MAPDAIRSCLDYLASKSNGEWLDKDKNRIIIYWMTPEQWANAIHKKVSANDMEIEYLILRTVASCNYGPILHSNLVLVLGPR